MDETARPMNKPTEHKIETVPVTRAYTVEQISTAGITGLLETTKEQREEIAKALDLLELEDFRFEYQLHRTKRGRFNLKGQLHARAIQSCVVTLEPVPAVIEEAININLWPAEDVEHLEIEAEPESMSLQLDGPEPISGDSIDVGLLAYEHFAAALDLYPKKSNAKLDWRNQMSGENRDERDNPFAALAKIKVMPGPDPN